MTPPFNSWRITSIAIYFFIKISLLNVYAIYDTRAINLHILSIIIIS